MPIKTLTAALFRPTTSMTGNEPPAIFRGQNMVLRGSQGNYYFEVFGGNKNLAENYNLDTSNYKLTGTVSFNADDSTIRGTTTVFKSQLHIGQMVLVATEVFVVKEILSNTAFISDRAPKTTVSSQTGFRLPQLFELNGKRGVLLTGSAIEMPKGHIITAGSGELYVNGAVLAGTSLTASNKPKAAIYRPSTNDYAVIDLGYSATPPKPTITPVSGGTKGMADGKYSFMVSYWSGEPEGLGGWSNPCEVIKLDGSAAPIEIDTGASKTRFEFDFTASLVGMPANAKGFIVYGSLAGKKTISVQGATTTTTSPNETNYENGSWFRVAKILTTDLAAGDLAYIEYLDADIWEEVTGNNDHPPDCEYVIKIEGKPAYVSCFGKRTVASDKGSNPGPGVVVGKFSNPDGAPTEWMATVSNDILGVFEGVGRWFVMTNNSLDFIVPTGLFGQSLQGGNDLELPIIARPYWRSGASNRYSITLIEDTLYGFSGKKLFRSIGNGDENVKKYEFGGVMKDVTRTWSSGYVFAVEDPKNSQVIFIHSAAYKNSSGYWVSEFYPFSLDSELNAWLPKIVLSSTTQDMIVSGAAVVNQQLEFLAGGRKAGGTWEMRTYRYDEEDLDTPLTSQPYYLVWQISDDGAENLSKVVSGVRPDGKFTSMNLQIHGARAGGELDITDMEDGTNSFTGNISFANSTQQTVYLEKRIKIKNLAKYAIRISGTWNGSGMKDRLDEIAVRFDVHGKRR